MNETSYPLDLSTPCILAEHYNSLGRATRNAEKYRVVWEKERGPIPPYRDLDHVCHNEDTTCPGGNDCPRRRCYNLLHIRLATRADNLNAGRKTDHSGRAKPTGYADVDAYASAGAAAAAKDYSKPGALDPITCDACGKVCRGIRAASAHKTVMHAIDRSVVCELCQRTYSTPYRYTRHLAYCETVEREKP